MMDEGALEGVLMVVRKDLKAPVGDRLAVSRDLRGKTWENALCKSSTPFDTKTCYLTTLSRVPRVLNRLKALPTNVFAALECFMYYLQFA